MHDPSRALAGSVLHVLGVNLSGAGPADRPRLMLSRADAIRLMHSVAQEMPRHEVVILRARHHCEAFLVAPPGGSAVRLWIGLLQRLRPDLLGREHRSLHYHLSGSAAHAHLARVVAGRYARSARPGALPAGITAALALAARCGTLGETLDGLFLRPLRAAAPPPVPSLS